MQTIVMGACAVAAVAVLAAPANAAHLSYCTANITPLSGSGVSGKANLTLNTIDNTLGVQITASGLVPNMVHVQHIHGRFNDAGAPIE